jgi:uncharacterized 2Fe-2S/4Fe-4S cluster protein (DUF4445 family)
VTDPIRIDLQPLGDSFEVERGAPLHDALFARGVEFPCGGRGICRGCRVRVLTGDAAVTPEDAAALAPPDLAAGWRLACRLRATGPLVLDVAQWETPILADDAEFAFAPRDGWGVAVDCGTTTLVAQLVDLSTGRVLAVQSSLNPQARHGADIMSRVQYALAPEGLRALTATIRGEIGRLVAGVLAAAAVGPRPVEEIVVVGNAVMHHLFGGLPLDPLSRVPFQPERDGPLGFRAVALGWPLPGDPPVRFLPCLGGFVGSDILAGILAARIHESDRLVALADLGTNGEVVLGTREKIWCASTAAGPAFEGARIAMGMRAAAGAIAAAAVEGGRLRCTVIGGGPPRGICGSGIVDAVAAGLDLGRIAPDGRLTGGASSFPIDPPVALTQADIRELQLAKGAIAAGFRILLDRAGAKADDVTTVYLAGAFGNYINRASALRIRLLEFPLDIIRPAGNTALRGAKVALFDRGGADGCYADIRRRVEHVPLAADPHFQEHYAGAMGLEAPPDRDNGVEGLIRL